MSFWSVTWRVAAVIAVWLVEGGISYAILGHPATGLGFGFMALYLFPGLRRHLFGPVNA